MKFIVTVYRDDKLTWSFAAPSLKEGLQIIYPKILKKFGTEDVDLPSECDFNKNGELTKMVN